MSKRVQIKIKRFTPLSGAEFSARRNAGLKMVIAADCAKFNLRIEGPHLKKASKAFGLDIPIQPCSMSKMGDKTALWLGPDEWLLLGPQPSLQEIILRFSALGKTAAHSLVEVSDRTVGIELSGSLAMRALNAGCPLDLENMPEGHCTRTVLDKAQIILIKFAHQRYRLEVMRSFAPYVWKFLQMSANHAAV